MIHTVHHLLLSRNRGNCAGEAGGYEPVLKELAFLKEKEKKREIKEDMIPSSLNLTIGEGSFTSVGVSCQLTISNHTLLLSIPTLVHWSHPP